MSDINVSILILSSSFDYSTDLVCAELEYRKAQYIRVNRDQFHNVTVSLDVLSCTLKIQMCGKIYHFTNDSKNSIFFRAPVYYRYNGKRESLEEQLHKGQWGAFMRNLVLFDKVFWMNNPVNTYCAENKAKQLLYANHEGLDVPKTIVTNRCPDDLSGDDYYVIKSIDTAIFSDENEEYFTYTMLMTGEEINKSDLHEAPVFIQEALLNKVDLRVTYINERMFPVKILIDGSGVDGDWRKNKKEELSYILCELPPKVEKALISLMRKFNLNYGGIDLALCNDSYYFIEVNPTGEWGWLKFQANLELDKAIADALIL